MEREREAMPVALVSFINEMEDYYESYYDEEEGFDNRDDIGAVVDLAMSLFENITGKKNEKTI